MFHTKNSKESLTGRCDVTDVSSETLDGLLKFIYGTHGPSTSEFAGDPSKLLLAAHKYQVFSVVTVCEKILADRVNGENTGEQLVFADHYNLPILKAAVLRFFGKHGRKFIRSGLVDVVRSCSKALFEEALTCVHGRLQLDVADQIGAKVTLHIKMTSTMDELWKMYEDCVGGPVGRFRFYYMGTRILDDHTPASLGIADGAVITVYGNR